MALFFCDLSGCLAFTALKWPLAAAIINAVALLCILAPTSAPFPTNNCNEKNRNILTVYTITIVCWWDRMNSLVCIIQFLFVVRGWFTSKMCTSPISAALINAVLPSSVFAFTSAPLSTRTYRMQHINVCMVFISIFGYQTNIISSCSLITLHFLGNLTPLQCAICFPLQQSLVLLRHFLSLHSLKHLSQ